MGEKRAERFEMKRGRKKTKPKEEETDARINRVPTERGQPAESLTEVFASGGHDAHGDMCKRVGRPARWEHVGANVCSTYKVLSIRR